MQQQTILELLKEFFKDNPKDWPPERINKLRLSFCRYYPCPTKRYTYTLGAYSLVQKENDDAKKSKFYSVARMLVLLGVPASVFGIEDLFPPLSLIQQKSRLEILVIDNTTDCSKEYSRINFKYIHQTKTTLLVHDYLGKGNLQHPEYSLNKKTLYLHAHRHGIFPKIVEQLKEYPKMQYTRILGLPIGGKKIVTVKKGDQHWWLKLRAVKYCSCQLFHHICECLALPRDHASDAQRPIFAVALCSRAQQFGLFDQQYVYNEYYRINKDGTVKPSYLTIDSTKLGDDIQNIAAMYYQEITTLSSTANLHLDLDDLAKLLEAYKENWRQEKHSNKDEKKLINRKIKSYNQFNAPTLPMVNLL